MEQKEKDDGLLEMMELEERSVRLPAMVWSGCERGNGENYGSGWSRADFNSVQRENPMPKIPELKVGFGVCRELKRENLGSPSDADDSNKENLEEDELGELGKGSARSGAAKTARRRRRNFWRRRPLAHFKHAGSGCLRARGLSPPSGTSMGKPRR